MITLIGVLIYMVIACLGMMITMICYVDWGIIPKTAPFDVIVFMGMVLSPIIVPIVGPYVMCRSLKGPILKVANLFLDIIDPKSTDERYFDALRAAHVAQSRRREKHLKQTEKMNDEDLYLYRMGIDNINK